MRSRLVALLIAVVCSTGCGAVLIGGLIAHSSTSRGQQKDFVEQFQRNNTEREKAGLPPLDFCTEAFRFDPGWAASLPECRNYVATASGKAPVQPAVTAAADTAAADTAAVAAADTTAPGATAEARPERATASIRLADGSLLTATEIRPSGMGTVEVIDVNGRKTRMDGSRIRSIYDANGVNWTEKILTERKQFPPK